MSLPPLPAELLQTAVTITARTGEGAYGPAFGAFVAAVCYWESKNKEVQDARGELRIATALAVFQPEVAIATGDRITKDGVVYEVITVDSAEPSGVLHHLEAWCSEVV